MLIKNKDGKIAVGRAFEGEKYGYVYIFSRVKTSDWQQIFLTPRQLRRLGAECERLADELEAVL